MKKFLIVMIMALISSSAFADNKVKIGIIGAEVDSLKQTAKISNKIIIADMEFNEGMLDNVDVVIVKCGMGKVNAAICTQILISKFGVTHVINTGVAGSLNNKLNIGDIVVASDTVQHDYDVVQISFKKGEIPYTCEMESGAIAQTFYLNHVPFVIIRAIADKADSSETPDFHEFEAQTAKLCANVTEYMVKNF